MVSDGEQVLIRSTEKFGRGPVRLQMKQRIRWHDPTTTHRLDLTALGGRDWPRGSVVARFVIFERNFLRPITRAAPRVVSPRSLWVPGPGYSERPISGEKVHVWVTVIDTMIKLVKSRSARTIDKTRGSIPGASRSTSPGRLLIYCQTVGPGDCVWRSGRTDHRRFKSPHGPQKM